MYHTVPSVGAVGTLTSEVDLAMIREVLEFPHEDPQSLMGKLWCDAGSIRRITITFRPTPCLRGN